MADGDNRPSDHDVGGPSEACERFGCADSAERSGLPSKVAMVDFRGPNRERCVNYFTLRTSIILMETIKDLYKRLP